MYINEYVKFIINKQFSIYTFFIGNANSFVTKTV